MRNASKINVRQFRNLLFARAENILFSTTLPQFLKPQVPKFSSTITFRNSVIPSNCRNAFHSSTTLLQFSTTKKSKFSDSDENEYFQNDTDVEDNDEPVWEDDDEGEPELGDGGDGGGVVLQNCRWGERALALANEVLSQFDDAGDMKLFAFKTSPKGYIYMRLDKVSTEYGHPEYEVLEEFSRQYKKVLDEAGESGELPEDLGLEVSSPGAQRLLKVPDDLQRFKHVPVTVNFVDNSAKNCQVKTSVFYLEGIDMETESCTWRLADVKENRDPKVKGKPLNRKQKDQRFQLPFTDCKKVMLYIA